MTKQILDFPNDPMLQELHDIGRELDERTKGMTPAEIAAFYNEQARLSAERRGYRYILGEDGFYHLEPKEEAA